MLPVDIQMIAEEFIPLFKALSIGKYGIAIGGSFGKGTFDKHSDLDFRLYGDELLSDSDEAVKINKQLQSLTEAYQKKGYRIDGYWPRKIGDINQSLTEWMSGSLKPGESVWCVWGYHLLPDIYHQHILDDPFEMLKGWKKQLRTYPPKLKHAILEKHLKSAKYWRDDYHYINKIRRRDIVFITGLVPKIVHNLIQILFALNETYYVGDGNNLDFLKQFERIPAGFIEQVEEVLFPETDEEGFMRQRELLITMINAVEELIPDQINSNT